MMHIQKPLILGILNVTPDSFSDGGLYFAKGTALRRAEELYASGADIIDVGGESTRPGALAVSMQEEMDRVLPVIEAIRQTIPLPISVDTRKFEIAREAVRLGASVINDVSGGSDIRLPSLCKDADITFLLMHMRGTPENMQDAPEYPRGVVEDVRDFLMQRVRAFGEQGVPPEKIWIDPGIGFGKTVEQNLQILASLRRFGGIAGRVALGTSRKSFLSKVSGDPNTLLEDREPGTLASNLWAATQGVSVFRVHNVSALRRALGTWEAIENARQ